jgi:Flp pilus assembly protein TadD
VTDVNITPSFQPSIPFFVALLSFDAFAMRLLNSPVYRTFHSQYSIAGFCKPPLAVFLTVCLYLLLISTALAQQSIKTLQPLPPSHDSVSRDPALAQPQLLLDQGKALEAEPLLRAYLATHPDSAEAHFLLGWDLFRQIQERARDTGSVPSTRSAPGTDAASAAKASLAEFTAGAQFAKPSSADLKIVALDYILLADYPDADKWLTKMLEWTPNDSEGWYYLGRTKYNENRFAEAISAFQQSLKLDPNNVKAEDNLGLAYAGLGRADDAIAAYHSAMESQKDATAKNPGPFIDLADLLLDQNRSPEAISYLQEAIQITPQDPKAHELLGKAYARLDRLPEAQAELEKAADVAPQNANLPCMLGPIYRKQGLTEKAKLALDGCAALNGTHSTPEAPRP